ncbi:MAG: phosphatase PAP2 family protein [Oligoflexia bacterium]|nr:phosphatase PAP2 family protein [Oligoflexia bacterium]
MKSELLVRLHAPPRFRKRDLLITLTAALLWTGAVFSRPYVLQPYCAERTDACTAANVLAFDRPGLGLNSREADHLSDMTQRISGALALAAPLAWNGGLAVLGRLSPATALAQAGTDILIILQSVFWNGVATEAAHALIQRPRPFVYASPADMGVNPAHYTSFYSGHTSFAAAANVALLLVLMARGAPYGLLILMASLGQGLILSTAFFRVLAGRHFVTDVLAGAVAGALIALGVAYLHKRRTE